MGVNIGVIRVYRVTEMRDVRQWLDNYWVNICIAVECTTGNTISKNVAGSGRNDVDSQMTTTKGKKVSSKGRDSCGVSITWMTGEYNEAYKGGELTMS